MPNHITNILTIHADEDEVLNILEAIKNDEHGIGSIDFNKLIPMPESLRIESGSRSNCGLALYRSYMQEFEAIAASNAENTDQSEAVQALNEKYEALTQDDPELMKIGRQCYENIQNYGHPDWYSWANFFWKTKWNSFGYTDFPQYEAGSNTIYFNTAWSPPDPVIQKLSEKYPDVCITHRWADEDFGFNVGERDYCGGEIIDENMPIGGSKNAYEMAADILEIDLDSEDSEYQLSADESTYLYLDECETYELIELFDKHALFSNDRVNASEIPQGLYCYDLRSDDVGNTFAAIEPRVQVNHAGSVITNFPIDFGSKGYIAFTEDNAPNFIGAQLNLRQYIHGEYEIIESPDETLKL